MAWEYTDKTKQLFMDALTNKPGTHLGEIENPDAVGEDGSIVCGDAMKIFLKIDKHPTDPYKDKITQVKYQTFGCTSAIASSEALCAMLEKSKPSPIEALKISNQDIVDYLGGLPEQKIHCSVMGADALKEAIKDWANRRNIDINDLKSTSSEHVDEEGKIVCRCFNFTDVELKEKITSLNLKTSDDVLNATKAGGGCGTCVDAPGGIRDILKEVWGVQISEKQINNLEHSECNFSDQINQVVKDMIRPYLQSHGGDISLIEIKGTKVYCTLQGACSSCAGAKYTLKNAVEKQLRQNVDELIEVIDI